MQNILRTGLVGLALMTLTACPPADDGEGSRDAAMDGGMAGMGAADAGLPEVFGDECVCEDDAFVCEEPCDEALICAAFTCTLRCTEDAECPEGYTCAALSDTNFENQETTNLGTKYCLGR